MVRLQWNPPADPPYERGVDRGLIDVFPFGFNTVWNGLISVEETGVGGESTANYFDGVKISESVATRNWQGIVRAYSYPKTFQQAYGNESIASGFYVTRQPRAKFSFSYRTKVGASDYKIHLIYNATLVSNQPVRKTMRDTPDPDIFEWTVNAVPWDQSSLTTMPKHRPTAHYVVDSRKLTDSQWIKIENLLYGDPATATGPSNFPYPQAIFDALNAV